MSVTFYTEPTNTQVRIACACGEVASNTVFASHQEAYRALHIEKTATVPQCGDAYCAADRSVTYLPLEETPEVNVSNTNASAIFDILGIKVGEEFEERCVGEMAADEFQGRVLIAAGLQPVDAGIPAIQEGNQVFCGRPEGYLNSRIEELRAVADYATANGSPIRWC